MLKPHDYLVIVVGILGTLNTLGALTSVPHIMVVLFGVCSSMIVGFSLLLLALNRYIRNVTLEQQRLFLLYILTNLIPTIYFMSHLTETPWERFVT